VVWHTARGAAEGVRRGSNPCSAPARCRRHASRLLAGQRAADSQVSWGELQERSQKLLPRPSSPDWGKHT